MTAFLSGENHIFSRGDVFSQKRGQPPCFPWKNRKYKGGLDESIPYTKGINPYI